MARPDVEDHPDGVGASEQVVLALMDSHTTSTGPIAEEIDRAVGRFFA